MQLLSLSKKPKLPSISESQVLIPRRKKVIGQESRTPAVNTLLPGDWSWAELCWAGLPLSGARVLRSAVYTGGSHALGLPCPAPCIPCWRLPSLLDAPGIGDEAVPSVITRLALLSGQRSFQSILEPHCAPYSPAQAASERLGRMFCSSPQR